MPKILVVPGRDTQCLMVDKTHIFVINEEVDTAPTHNHQAFVPVIKQALTAEGMPVLVYCIQAPFCSDDQTIHLYKWNKRCFPLSDISNNEILMAIDKLERHGLSVALEYIALKQTAMFCLPGSFWIVAKGEKETGLGWLQEPALVEEENQKALSLV